MSMVFSMNDKKPVLIIVEGSRAEPRFFDRISQVYGLNFSICCLNDNIYALYKMMKEMDFNADIKEVLLVRHPEYGEILENQFLYTYLVFDMDPHHTKKEEGRSLDQVVLDNCTKIQEMAEYFIDETDPTVGRLYVNYPMLESFRACDSVFDEAYRYEYVKLEDIHTFKTYVGTKKLVRKHLKDYSKNDFQSLTKMNVYKLNTIISGIWSPMPYSQYLTDSQLSSVLEIQKNLIEDTRRVAVLNTSLFMMLDYFGNRDGFYDEIMEIDRES